ncbi:translation initiation factor IF-2, partial [Treponema sp. R6D11]
SVVGRVRAMESSHGKKIKQAKPSVPVRILGLSEAPIAGEMFYVMQDEKRANKIAEMRKFNERREADKLKSGAITLETLFSKGDELKNLNLIIKGDVQGSVEAVWQSLEKLQNEEVQVKIVHGGVGGVTESDIMLASASGAIIIAFNVRPERAAADSAERQGIEIRYYRVIYKLIEEIEQAMHGMLSPEFKEQTIGHMEVRQTYKVSAVGTIAGCYVTDGMAKRDAKVRVVRDNIVIHEGELSSLKRFKDDVKEVQSGYECGSSIEKFNDIKDGDVFELYEIVEVARDMK